MEQITKEEHIRNWEKSNQSKSAYCRENGLCYGSFLNWQRKQKGNQSTWQPVSIKEEPEQIVSKSFFELRIGDSFEVNLRIQF